MGRVLFLKRPCFIGPATKPQLRKEREAGASNDNSLNTEKEGEVMEMSRLTERGAPGKLLPEAIASVDLMDGPSLPQILSLEGCNSGRIERKSSQQAKGLARGIKHQMSTLWERKDNPDSHSGSITDIDPRSHQWPLAHVFFWKGACPQLPTSIFSSFVLFCFSKHHFTDLTWDAAEKQSKLRSE